MRQRCLMLGAGGMAEEWITRILPRVAERAEIVGLVDVSEAALETSGNFLGLDKSRRFRDMQSAFDSVEADFCIVVVPAAFHAEAVVQAAQRGMAILCEKPLADTWTACRDIARAVRQSGVKMQVVQNYRYHPQVMAMKNILSSRELGRLNYLVARFRRDYREFDSWHRRHHLPHAMLMDGAAHHLDMLRNLSGGDCARISTQEWNPSWSNSAGEFCALCLLSFTNGVRATYEGNALAAGQQNGWHSESYRAECEGGSVTLGADGIVRVHRHRYASGILTEEVPLTPLPRDGHDWIIAEFLEWLDGGSAPATTLEDNLCTAATIFGAIESAQAGQVVDVTRMLESI